MRAMWRYREPDPGDYESEIEYQESVAAYEYALDCYINEKEDN